MKRPFAEHRPIGPFAQKSASQSRAFYGDNLTISVAYEPTGSGKVDTQLIEMMIEGGHNPIKNCSVNIDNASKFFQLSSNFNVVYAQTGHAYLYHDDIDRIGKKIIGEVNRNRHKVKPDDSNSNVRENYYVGEGPDGTGRLYPGSNFTIVIEANGVSKQALDTDDAENKVESNVQIDDCTVVFMDGDDSLPKDRMPDVPDAGKGGIQEEEIEEVDLGGGEDLDSSSRDGNGFGERIKSIKQRLDFSQSGSNSFTAVLFTDEPYLDVDLMKATKYMLEMYIIDNGGAVGSDAAIGEGP